jgi:hypothetical protein
MGTKATDIEKPTTPLTETELLGLIAIRLRNRITPPREFAAMAVLYVKLAWAVRTKKSINDYVDASPNRLDALVLEMEQKEK